MKRLSAFLLFAFLAPLILAIPAGAVGLQAGWLAAVGSVALYGSQWEGDHLREWGADYIFTTSPGIYGPLSVSYGTAWWQPTVATVWQDAQGITPGTILELNGYFSTANPFYSQVYAEWETNYDPTRMQLQLLWRRQGSDPVLLWTENRADHQRHGTFIVSDLHGETILPTDQLAFQIVAIPEPNSLSALAMMVGGAGVLFGTRRRR